MHDGQIFVQPEGSTDTVTYTYMFDNSTPYSYFAPPDYECVSNHDEETSTVY